MRSVALGTSRFNSPNRFRPESKWHTSTGFHRPPITLSVASTSHPVFQLYCRAIEVSGGVKH